MVTTATLWTALKTADGQTGRNGENAMLPAAGECNTVTGKIKLGLKRSS